MLWINIRITIRVHLPKYQATCSLWLHWYPRHFVHQSLTPPRPSQLLSSGICSPPPSRRWQMTEGRNRVAPHTDRPTDKDDDGQWPNSAGNGTSSRWSVDHQNEAGEKGEDGLWLLMISASPSRQFFVLTAIFDVETDFLYALFIFVSLTHTQTDRHARTHTFYRSCWQYKRAQMFSWN